MILPCHVTLLWCYSEYSVFHLHVWFASVSGSTSSGRRRATSNKGPTYVFICKSVLFTHSNMVERQSASQTAHSCWSDNHFRSTCTYVRVMFFFLPYYGYCRFLIYIYIYIYIYLCWYCLMCLYMSNKILISSVVHRSCFSSMWNIDGYIYI